MRVAALISSSDYANKDFPSKCQTVPLSRLASKSARPCPPSIKCVCVFARQFVWEQVSWRQLEKGWRHVNPAFGIIKMVHLFCFVFFPFPPWCVHLCSPQGCQGLCGARLGLKGHEPWVPGRPAEEPHWDRVCTHLPTAKAHHSGGLPETGQLTQPVCVHVRWCVCIWAFLKAALQRYVHVCKLTCTCVCDKVEISVSQLVARDFKVVHWVVVIGWWLLVLYIFIHSFFCTRSFLSSDAIARKYGLTQIPKRNSHPLTMVLSRPVRASLPVVPLPPLRDQARPLSNDYSKCIS